MNRSDFDYIYNADGTCHLWYCGKPGVVLAYDEFSPEGALWFCSECWQEFAVSGMPEPSRVIPPDRWERLTNFSGVIIFDEMLPRGDLMLLDIDVVNGEARVSVSGKIFAGKWIAKAQDKDVSEEEM